MRLHLRLRVLLPVLAAGASTVTDPNCPPASCCEEVDGKGLQGGYVGCFVNPLWTEGYCCPGGPASDCYRWGLDKPGHDLASFTLQSAVQCRHLCQSHDRCAYWTYAVNVPELGALRATCHLKSHAALAAQFEMNPFVVSGERACKYFQEALSAQEARQRIGMNYVVWRTSRRVTARGARKIFGFQLLHSAGTSGWHSEAASVFADVGAIAVIDALDLTHAQGHLHELQQVAGELMERDPLRIGNRGPRRYSYGASSRTGHTLHLSPWTKLLDNEAMSIVLQDIFPDGYRIAGGGGDFVLGKTDTYQSLHLDTSVDLYKAGTPPAVVVNFVLENLTCADAPTRLVPRTQRRTDLPPVLTFEPHEMKHSVLCPLPAGSIIIRDLRTWHGGTPNGANRTRFLPGIEILSEARAQVACGTGVGLDPCRPLLPQTVHSRLRAHARAASIGLVDSSGRLEQSIEGWLSPRFPQAIRHSEFAY